MRSSNGALKLFVGGIGDNRKSDLNRLFSKYGEISTIYIDENKHFAFVEFISSIDAQRALEHTHNKIVNGSKLRVEYAKSDKVSRDNRRSLSRDHSPTSTLYSHLQVTANRLPSMQMFRQSYYQHYPLTMTTNPMTTSRGRSLTPPSFKQNACLPPMHHLRSQDLYYHHPAIYSDPNYYRTYGDPYLMQRLPPPVFLPSTPPPSSSSSSSSRAYRNMYSSSGINRDTSNISTSSHHRRSRSRHRNSLSYRNRSSREQKHKRRTSSSLSSSTHEQKCERGPRTPPSKSSTHRSRKR
ncbi:unnamed protein product [Rotaria sp. Silwood2]|nr:unnamed protein product [Rotaria sp. Silwood2]CAF3047476.1 unnamed protein product [Rotaria sp. Silwood2]CAF4325492.1 unnamed protein product [Rotaria sp. Silwood2]CAF4475640.1 unnamed protein product [Rotaria sp. Silwood2]